MSSLEKWAKTTERNNLEKAFLELNKHFIALEEKLIKELGKETYYDICKELAKEHIQKEMREHGIEEKEIEKYTKFMDCVESEKS